MKRSEILEKLGAIENAKEICDYIMAEYGKDLAKEKEKFEELQKQMAEAQEKHNADLKAKDEELAKFNVEEIEGLKAYKEQNEAKIKTDKQNNSIKEFLKKNEYSVDDVLLSYVSNNMKPSFDENFAITNADELLTGLKTNASQYKITAKEEGAKAMTPQSSEPAQSSPKTLADAIAQKLNNKGD